MNRKRIILATELTSQLLISLFVLQSSHVVLAQCAPVTLLERFLNPEPGPSDYFGISVAISGNRAVVGAYFDHSGSVRGAGAAYVFDAATGQLVSTLTNPSPTTGDFFGGSVAISDNLAVVGAYAADPGGAAIPKTAYVFNATTGALVAKLENPAPEVGDSFAGSVAISNNLAVVGASRQSPDGVTFAGAAYVFNATTGALVATLKGSSAFDFLGSSVALSGDLAVAGASYADSGGVFNSGAAYVFHAVTGTLATTLLNPSPVVDDYFGDLVAISGNLAVVKAKGDGVVTQTRVHVFDAVTGLLKATIHDRLPVPESSFAASIAIHNNLIAVGQPNAGYSGNYGLGFASLYDASTGVHQGTIVNPNLTSWDWFGESLGISEKGVVVGAYRNDPQGVGDAGTAFIFGCLDSIFPAHTIPSELPLNHPLPVTFTISNTSVTEWSANAGYWLRELSDPCGISPGSERLLDPNVTVAPGASHVFSTTLVGAPAPGLCNLQFVMTRYGSPFGATLNVTLEVVAAVNDADLITHTIPATMTPGQELWVGVKFKNTGNTAWIPGGGHGLGVFGADDCSLFPQLRFAPSASVLPGENHQFMVRITAPPTPATCSFTLQMLEEFVEWFGDPLPMTLNVAERPNAVAEWAQYQ